MLFSGATTMEDIPLPEIQHPKYQFKDFEQILNKDYDTIALFDFIGAVCQMLFTPTESQKKAFFTFRDLRGHTLHCTLWDEYAKQIQTAFSNRNQSKPFVIIVTNMRVNEPKGNYPLTLANTFYSTKVILNQDLPEINDFISRLTPTQSLELSTQLSSQISHSSQFSEYDRFMYRAPAFSISQIKKLSEETNCTTVGTTYKLIASKNGWTILGCSACSRAWKEAPPHQCFCGAITEVPVLRYKVEIEVKHMNVGYNFTFWDSDCEALLKISAADLMKKMNDEGDLDPKSYPLALDNQLNLTLAFRVKVSPKWNTASISRCSDDNLLIGKILEKMKPDEDGDCSIDNSKSIISDSEGPSYQLLSQQAFSGTADYDPDLLITNSPSKMLTLGESADEFKSPYLQQQNCPQPKL